MIKSMLGHTIVFYYSTFPLPVSTNIDSEEETRDHLGVGFPHVQLLEAKDNIQWPHAQGQEPILDCNRIAVHFMNGLNQIILRKSVPVCH